MPRHVAEQLVVCNVFQIDDSSTTFIDTEVKRVRRELCRDQGSGCSLLAPISRGHLANNKTRTWHAFMILERIASVDNLNVALGDLAVHLDELNAQTAEVL